MEQVLVTYITHSGTTRDVAEAIAEEITKTDHEAELLPLSKRFHVRPGASNACRWASSE